MHEKPALSFWVFWATPRKRPRNTGRHACSQLGYHLCVAVLAVELIAFSLSLGESHELCQVDV